MKAKSSAQVLKELRQQCVELGLRDTGNRKVLEARLQWAALPEKTLREIGSDLELISARTSTKEVLVEVLLSEYQNGNVELPAVTEDQIAEEAPEPETAPPPEPEKPRRRKLKKGGLDEQPPAEKVPEKAAEVPVEMPAPAPIVAPSEPVDPAPVAPVVAPVVPAPVVPAPVVPAPMVPAPVVPAPVVPPPSEKRLSVSSVGSVGSDELAPSPFPTEIRATGEAPTFDFKSPIPSAAPSAAVSPRQEFFEDAKDEDEAPEEDVALAALAALHLSPLKDKNNNVKQAKAKAPKGPSVVELRQACQELGVRTDGPRGLLLARKSWAQLSGMELRLTASKLEAQNIHLPTERAAIVEQLVLLQQAGTIAPPMASDENVAVKTEIAVPAMCRGAFARATDLHDTLRIYFLGRAKTDRSSCTRCNQAIELNEWRVGNNRSASGFTAWWHTSCFSTAFGRPDVSYQREAEVVTLLRELETSNGRWSLFESKLLETKCNRFRAAKALKAGLKKPSRAKPKAKGLWDSDDEGETA